MIEPPSLPHDALTQDFHELLDNCEHIWFHSAIGKQAWAFIAQYIQFREAHLRASLTGVTDPVPTLPKEKESNASEE